MVESGRGQACGCLVPGAYMTVGSLPADQARQLGHARPAPRVEQVPRLGGTHLSDHELWTVLGLPQPGAPQPATQHSSGTHDMMTPHSMMDVVR